MFIKIGDEFINPDKINSVHIKNDILILTLDNGDEVPIMRADFADEELEQKALQKIIDYIHEKMYEK